MQDIIRKIEFLAGSPYRAPILVELDKGKASWEDLKKRCEASRTTLQRNLKALEDQGWVRNTNRTYTLTKQGEAVTEQLLQLIETMRAADQVQPVLQWLPCDEFDLDLRLLVDATVISTADGDPYAVQNHYINRLREVQRVQALLPATGIRSWYVAHEQTLTDELECEIIVSPSVAETIQSSHE